MFKNYKRKSLGIIPQNHLWICVFTFLILSVLFSFLFIYGKVLLKIIPIRTILFYSTSEEYIAEFLNYKVEISDYRFSNFFFIFLATSLSLVYTQFLFLNFPLVRVFKTRQIDYHKACLFLVFWAFFIIPVTSMVMYELFGGIVFGYLENKLWQFQPLYLIYILLPLTLILINFSMFQKLFKLTPKQILIILLLFISITTTLYCTIPMPIEDYNNYLQKIYSSWKEFDEKSEKFEINVY